MMASTPSLHKEQAATGRLKRKQTPTTSPADTLGDEDGSSDSSIPSDDDQFLESLKTELLSKKKIVLPAGFLAPISRECRPSAVKEQDEVVAPPRRDGGDGNSSLCGVTNSLKRRRSQNDEWKNINTCSDNSLQPNIAEEINGHAHALQKDPHCNNIPVNSESVTKNIQSSSEFPSFFISMKPSHVKSFNRSGRYLSLPAELCKHHLPDKDTTIILKDENGVEYKTTYRTYVGRSSCLSAGWAVFCNDHKLAVGDVLRFQLVNQTKFEVSIVKSNHQYEKVAEDEDAIFEKPRRNLKKRNVTNPRKRRRCVKKVSTPSPSEDGSSCDHSPCSEDSSQLNIEEIRLQKGRHCNSPPNLGSSERTKNIQSSSEFPSFLISMKPSYVNGRGRYLRLPAEFCKHHLPDKDTTMILKDENGEEYKTTHLTRAGGSSCLSAGWAVFCDDHKLAVGDVLRFQLVNLTKFEVSIVKSNHQYEKVAEKPRRNLKKRNRRPRGVPSTPWVVCIDELTQRLEEAEAARHADKEAIINDMQKKYDSIMAAMQKISPRVQAPDTLVPDVDSDEAHQVTNPSKDGSSCDHSPCSEDSSQLNIAEIRLQKGRHCNNPLNPGSVEPAKNIQSSSEFPSFFISMKPSYVGSGRKLSLPAEFCKHHLPDKDSTVDSVFR